LDNLSKKYSWDAGAEIEWKREFSDSNSTIMHFSDLEALSEAWFSMQSIVCPQHWCV